MAGYSPWGLKELDMTERLHFHFSPSCRFLRRQVRWSGISISFIVFQFVVILLLLLLSRFSCVDSVQPHRRQPTRLRCTWDSPGKNTRVGCHFLLQCMKVKSESEVTQSCLTLSDPMDFSLRGSSVHGIFQARVLEWGAIAFSHYRGLECKSKKSRNSWSNRQIWPWSME